MKRQNREQLERTVQGLEREHSEWPASRVESALLEAAPIAYGEWREGTPAPRSGLRGIQRWTTGARGRDPGRRATHLVPFVWPIGEKQRQEIDASWTISRVV